MSYSNILVAVDLSEESSQVLDKAKLIATNNGASMHLLTAIKPLTQIYGGLDMAPISAGTVSFEEEALKQARSQLQKLAAAYGIDEKNVHVVLGAPVREIRQLAVDIPVDLIVMGTHGRHGLGLLMGSTANGVLHGVECDVLAVRVDFE